MYVSVYLSAIAHKAWMLKLDVEGCLGELNGIVNQMSLEKMNLFLQSDEIKPLEARHWDRA